MDALRVLVLTLDEIGPKILEKRLKIVNSLQTDKGIGDQNSSLMLSVQVC